MDWFRMYHEFASDPKVQSMSEALQRRLVMLLCLRCSNALVTLQDDEIAFALRISEEELAETKAVFLRKGFINDDWSIANWEKRQFISDSSAARVAKHRAKKKDAQKQGGDGPVTPRNVTETPPEQNRTDTESREAKTSATRLSPDWFPDDELIAFCAAERKDLDPIETAHRFRDYWIAQPGVKGRKVDWPATWRNWVRNEKTPVRILQTTKRVAL